MKLIHINLIQYTKHIKTQINAIIINGICMLRIAASQHKFVGYKYFELVRLLELQVSLIPSTFTTITPIPVKIPKTFINLAVNKTHMLCELTLKIKKVKLI